MTQAQLEEYPQMATALTEMYKRAFDERPIANPTAYAQEVRDLSCTLQGMLVTAMYTDALLFEEMLYLTFYIEHRRRI